MYGAPINFMYKSKDTYQTIYGGLFTIITRLLVLAFFIYGLIDVFNRQNSIVKKTLYRDPLKENIRIDVDQQKFDIGMTFAVYDFQSDFYDNIYRYFQVKVSNSTVGHNKLGGYEWEEDFFQLSSCSQERFGDDKTIREEMHTDSLLCPDNLKFLLAGSVTGNFSSFTIFIKPCDNDVLIQQNKNFTCASQTEIKEIFDQAWVQVLIMTSYFDVYEFNQSPIKYTYTNFDYYLSYTQGVQQYFNLQKNFVDTQDSWFGNMIGNVQYSYLELIKGAQQYYQAQEGGNPQFTIQFYTSSNEDHTTRSVKTFIDCISLTGGLSSVIALIAKLSIVKVQQKYLHQSIIKKIFKIQKKQKKQASNLSINGGNDQNQEASLLQEKSFDNQNELRHGNISNKLKSMKLEKGQIAYYQGILSSRVKAKLNYVGTIVKQTILNKICCTSKMKNIQNNSDILIQNAMHMLYQQFDIVKILKTNQKCGLLMKLSLDENQQLLTEYAQDSLIPSKLIIENETKESSILETQLIQLNSDDRLSKALNSLIEKSKKDKLSQKLLIELLSQEGYTTNKEFLPKTISKIQSPQKSSRSKSSFGKVQQANAKQDKSFKKMMNSNKKSKDNINQDNYVSDATSSLQQSQDNFIGKKINKLKTKIITKADSNDLTPFEKNKT
eukprot:403345503